MADYYRVREARVEVCNGYRCWRERRFIADRRVFVLWFSFWWPAESALWRITASQAQADAECDADLRSPLSPPIILEPTREQ